MIYCSLVPTDEVVKVWPRIRRYVIDVDTVANGRTSIDVILDELLHRKRLLWVVFDHDGDGADFMGFAITSINFYPGKRMLSVDYLGGERMSDWLTKLDSILSEFGCSQECNGIEAVGRKGWERELGKIGWTTKYIVAEKIFVPPEAIGATFH